MRYLLIAVLIAVLGGCGDTKSVHDENIELSKTYGYNLAVNDMGRCAIKNGFPSNQDWLNCWNEAVKKGAGMYKEIKATVPFSFGIPGKKEILDEGE